MNNILQKYEISFYRRIFNGMVFYEMKSVNDNLSGIIINWQNSSDVIAVINTTNDLVNGTRDRITFTNETLDSIDVNSTITKFYDTPYYDDTTPCLSLPTTDFIQILTLWKDFLVNNSQ
jgi:hypothetical protein